MRYQSRYNQASPSEANNWGVRGTCRCGAAVVTDCIGRSACDEFWDEVHDAKRAYLNPAPVQKVYATEKQLAYAKMLITTVKVEAKPRKRTYGLTEEQIAIPYYEAPMTFSRVYSVPFASFKKECNEVLEAIAKGERIEMYKVSDIISNLKWSKQQGRGTESLVDVAPKAEAPAANVEAPTTKQIGFMNVLLKKKDVPTDLLAQVEGAKASKAKASKLIDALTKCADKVAVSA